MKSLLFLALLTTAVQAPPGIGQGAWSPNTKWVVRFDEDKCAAIREYRSGDRTLRIDVEPTPMQDHWSVNVEVPERFADLNKRALPSFLVGNEIVPDNFPRVGISARKGYLVYSTFLDGPMVQRLKQSRSLTLRSSQSSYALALTDLELLQKTLDICMVDLIETWGFSKEEQARVAVLPKPVGGTIRVSSDDYPVRAMKLNASGSARFRLTIGADGRVKDCRILKSSGSPDLDAASCRASRRTRFTPARDRAGQPMEAPVFSRISWVLL